MKNQSPLFKSVRALTLAAMLAAMSVVIGIFCKTLLNFGNGLMRITFENLPIILSGILFGPIAGGAVGAASDLMSYLMSPQTYPPNLVVTLGAAVIGIVSGVVSRFIIKKRGYLQTIVCVSAAHVIGSMIIKSVGLFQFYGWGVLVRIPVYIVIASIEALILCLLFKNSTFASLIDGIMGDKKNDDVQ